MSLLAVASSIWREKREESFAGSQNPLMFDDQKGFQSKQKTGIPMFEEYVLVT